MPFHGLTIDEFNLSLSLHNFLTIKWDNNFSIHHFKKKVTMANDVESQFTNELFRQFSSKQNAKRCALIPKKQYEALIG